jgi:hypothetical protein
MKSAFWIGVVALALLEFLLVYFIMPLPGSQRMRSIDIAYALYTWRWALRATCGVLIALGAQQAWKHASWVRWLVPASLVAVDWPTAPTSAWPPTRSSSSPRRW